MYSRRHFLSIVCALPMSLSAYADSDKVSKGSPSSLQINHEEAFLKLLADPHIKAALAFAKSDTSAPIGSKNQLFMRFSGCVPDQSTQSVINGFQERKTASLDAFEVECINGYMLTEEEKILGQLLAMS